MSWSTVIVFVILFSHIPKIYKLNDLLHYFFVFLWPKNFNEEASQNRVVPYPQTYNLLHLFAIYFLLQKVVTLRAGWFLQRTLERRFYCLNPNNIFYCNKLWLCELAVIYSELWNEGFVALIQIILFIARKTPFQTQLDFSASPQDSFFDHSGIRNMHTFNLHLFYRLK